MCLALCWVGSWEISQRHCCTSCSLPATVFTCWLITEHLCASCRVKGKSCPSTAFFSYSTWPKKNTNIHYRAGFNSIYAWNIELNILDLSRSLFKTENRNPDFCLKMFITASKKVLSICQTHSVTNYLDQLQIFLLPQIYIRSQNRKRERILFFFSAIINKASFRTNWFNMWSRGVVLILELFICLQRTQGYLGTGTMDQHLHTCPVPPCTARQAMPSTATFFHCLHTFPKEAPLGTH